MSVREQQSDDDFSQRFRMLPLRQLLHKQHVCAPFGKCDNRPFAVLSHDGIHLPVSEAFAVGFLRSFMDAYPLGYVLYFCGAFRASVPVILHFMAAMGGEFSAFVSADVAIYKLVGDKFASAFHVGRDLLGRPVLVFEQFQCLPYDCRIFRSVGGSPLSALNCLVVCLVPQVVAFFCRVAPYLAAER